MKSDRPAIAREPRSCGTAPSDAIGCVDCDGEDHFNFEQRIWLYPGVAMRATTRYTRAAEVLAVNILSLGLPEGPQNVALARKLALVFYSECLAELPDDGWCIPLDTIRDWLSVRRELESHLNLKQHPNLSARGR